MNEENEIGPSPKRTNKEWRDAIVMVIEQRNGEATNSQFYADIPKIINLTEWEKRPSTKKASYEKVWRGTLRGYLTQMVQDGTLIKQGPTKQPIFRLRNHN